MPYFTKHFDTASLLVILITLALFAMALITEGWTHDLLLEAAVFLVSVKLIHSSYKFSVFVSETKLQLEDIATGIRRIAENSRESQRDEDKRKIA